MKKALIAVFLTLLSSALIAADDGERGEGALTVEEVVITATRTQESTLDVPQHVTVVSAEDIEEMNAMNLAAVLNTASSVSIVDYGPQGAQQNLRIRGSTTTQVLVLVDGVRVNNAQSGGADLSMIPLENIERIEIVRGGTSALYGADAVGGVVNIITKKEADDLLRIRVENGSYIPRKALGGTGSSEAERNPQFTDLFDTQKLSLNYSKELAGVDLVMAGDLVRANNSFVFLDTTNVCRRRDNADLVGGNLSSSVQFKGAEGTFNLSGFGHYSDKGVPGQLGSLSPDAGQTDLKAGGSFGYKSESFISEYATLDVRSYFDYSRLEYVDPKFSVDSTHDVYSTGIDASQELLAFDLFSLIYGGNFGFDRIDSTDIGGEERVSAGIFLGSAMDFIPRLTLQPVLRYDYYSDFEGSLNFRLGATYALTDSKSLKGGVSRSFRAPTFNDLYWPREPFAEGNPDLKPETGYSLDFGLSTVGEHVSWNVFGFFRYVEDVIVWQAGDDNVWRPSNFDSGIYPGVETSLKFRFLDWYTFMASYTFLYSFSLSGEYELSDSKRIPLIPVHEIDAGVAYSRGKNRLSLSALYEGLRYLKVENRAYLPSVFLLNAHYRRAISDVFSLLISGDNLLNESYQTVGNYPMPGLYIRTGVEAVF